MVKIDENWLEIYRILSEMSQMISYHPQWLLMGDDSLRWHGSITFDQIQGIWGLLGQANGQNWAKIGWKSMKSYLRLSQMISQHPQWLWMGDDSWNWHDSKPLTRFRVYEVFQNEKTVEFQPKSLKIGRKSPKSSAWKTGHSWLFAMSRDFAD